MKGLLFAVVIIAALLLAQSPVAKADLNDYKALFLRLVDQDHEMQDVFVTIRFGDSRTFYIDGRIAEVGDDYVCLRNNPYIRCTQFKKIIYFAIGHEERK